MGLAEMQYLAKTFSTLFPSQLTSFSGALLFIASGTTPSEPQALPRCSMPRWQSTYPGVNPSVPGSRGLAPRSRSFPGRGMTLSPRPSPCCRGGSALLLHSSLLLEAFLIILLFMPVPLGVDDGMRSPPRHIFSVLYTKHSTTSPSSLPHLSSSRAHLVNSLLTRFPRLCEGTLLPHRSDAIVYSGPVSRSSNRCALT